MAEVTNPDKRRNAACACKETVDKCRESSRGSCSPSKRPLLGGECPSNYIRKIQDVMETLIASLEFFDQVVFQL
eukprot:Em0001g306a